MEVYLNGKRVAGAEEKVSDSNEAFDVSRAYILQHWVQACAGRGAYPIKFNGSLLPWMEWITTKALQREVIVALTTAAGVGPTGGRIPG